MNIAPQPESWSSNDQYNHHYWGLGKRNTDRKNGDKNIKRHSNSKSTNGQGSSGLRGERVVKKIHSNNSNNSNINNNNNINNNINSNSNNSNINNNNNNTNGQQLINIISNGRQLINNNNQQQINNPKNHQSVIKSNHNNYSEQMSYQSSLNDLHRRDIKMIKTLSKTALMIDQHLQDSQYRNKRDVGSCCQGPITNNSSNNPDVNQNYQQPITYIDSNTYENGQQSQQHKIQYVKIDLIESTRNNNQLRSCKNNLNGSKTHRLILDNYNRSHKNGVGINTNRTVNGDLIVRKRDQQYRGDGKRVGDSNTNGVYSNINSSINMDHNGPNMNHINLLSNKQPHSNKPIKPSLRQSQPKHFKPNQCRLNNNKQQSNFSNVQSTKHLNYKTKKYVAQSTIITTSRPRVQTQQKYHCQKGSKNNNTNNNNYINNNHKNSQKQPQQTQSNNYYYHNMAPTSRDTLLTRSQFIQSAQLQQTALVTTRIRSPHSTNDRIYQQSKVSRGYQPNNNLSYKDNYQPSYNNNNQRSYNNNNNLNEINNNQLHHHHNLSPQYHSPPPPPTHLHHKSKAQKHDLKLSLPLTNNPYRTTSKRKQTLPSSSTVTSLQSIPMIQQQRNYQLRKEMLPSINLNSQDGHNHNHLELSVMSPYPTSHSQAKLCLSPLQIISDHNTSHPTNNNIEMPTLLPFDYGQLSTLYHRTLELLDTYQESQQKWKKRANKAEDEIKKIRKGRMSGRDKA